MTTDFRAKAAEATSAKLKSLGVQSLADLKESGCIEVGGRGIRYVTVLASLVVILGCWAALAAAFLLKMKGIISSFQALGFMLMALLVTLVLRKVATSVVNTVLRGRRDGFLKAFPQLPKLAIGIEDGETVSNLKLFIEDEGVCLLDAERRRLLIEGCSFRHVIYANDVSCVEPLSGYALSGVRLGCNLAGQPLELALKTAGHGPISSLMHAYAPHVQAADMTSTIKHTLFGESSNVQPSSAIPPLLPRT